MRSMWLEKISTGERWDCLPKDPYKIDGTYHTVGGCAFINPTGLGYEQSVEQTQIEQDYVINKIVSANVETQVSAYFYGHEHKRRFYDFIGDFSEPLYLYYSPDGSINVDDEINKPFYKQVVVSMVDPNEMNSAGFVVVKIKFKPQSNVWRKDYEQVAEFEDAVDGELMYNYTYNYVLGGQSYISSEIHNGGRETGLVVELTNTGTDPINSVYWTVATKNLDKYGNEIVETQKAKFFVTLRQNDTILVDSNATKQMAVVTYVGGEQNVKDAQEPSWEYINFARLKHGTNFVRIYVQNANNVTVSIRYSELYEVV